jgi:hypothetical protein
MNDAVEYPVETSDKSRGVALALAVVLGPFGGHRFYLGRPRSGALMLATLGGLGIWYLYDVILVASGSFRDGQQRLVRRWDPEEAVPVTPLPAEVLDELDFLRSQMAELSERLDFAERLLARPPASDGSARPTSPS